eukprot:TRINITY_DN23926_c0_g1_i3.p1 TRINITY_DN23926_c0_g1~~TRINITY_DN23926_c0_g1_i3.p1  ORF type:complete len:317 (+),score=40.08 TRINITY_DN23926_c0_g1_i3:64-951(+)
MASTFVLASFMVAMVSLVSFTLQGCGGGGGKNDGDKDTKVVQCFSPQKGGLPSYWQAHLYDTNRVTLKSEFLGEAEKDVLMVKADRECKPGASDVNVAMLVQAVCVDEHRIANTGFKISALVDRTEDGKVKLPETRHGEDVLLVSPTLVESRQASDQVVEVKGACLSGVVAEGVLRPNTLVRVDAYRANYVAYMDDPTDENAKRAHLYMPFQEFYKHQNHIYPKALPHIIQQRHADGGIRDWTSTSVTSEVSEVPATFVYSQASALLQVRRLRKSTRSLRKGVLQDGTVGSALHP